MTIDEIKNLVIKKGTGEIRENKTGDSKCGVTVIVYFEA